MLFPRSARYAKATKAACSFLLHENIRNFPVDPFEIIHRNKWGLMTYSELAKENNLTIKEVIRACQSEDAYVTYNGINHTIAYNDTIKLPNRIRFTLMHEIGHIYLNHLVDFDETLMTRNSLSQIKYKILENETNHFARNVLAPAAIVFRLNINTIGDIVQNFQLTKAAAETRVQLLARDALSASNYVTDLWNHFEEYINTATNSKFCLRCGHCLSAPQGVHCPICGNSEISNKKGANFMIYDGYVLGENGRALRCPRCDNEEVNAGEHCKVCGVMLVNKCENRRFDRDGDLEWACDTIAEGNARHCVMCGLETTFYKNKFLDRWDKAFERLNKITDAGLPF